MSERSVIRRIGYDALWFFVRVASLVFFRIRCHGTQWEPREGAALICSNHQSYLDPVFVGLTYNRRLSYMARKTLFRWGPFAGLLEFMDAIPIDREGASFSGMKKTLRRLKRGEMVLIFPEGTRSWDGSMSPFEAGLLALARRGKAPLAPVAVDGAYDAWPRRRRCPRSAAVHVVLGEPISVEMAAGMSDDELLEELERRVRGCWERARRFRGVGAPRARGAPLP